MNKSVIHQVFFWLKDPQSKSDLSKLIEGLRTFSGIAAINEMHIGVPAPTAVREVVDSSYAVSELLFFSDLAGQKQYQDHPIHKKFVQDCSPLWEKVIVYDSEIVDSR